MFISDIREAFTLTFCKIDTVITDLPLLTEEELNRTEEQLETDRMECMLSLQTEVKMTIFVKWLLLVLAIATATLGLHLLFEKSLMAILPLIILVPLFKLYLNRRRMIEMKSSFISFLFQLHDELDYLSKKVFSKNSK